MDLLACEAGFSDDRAHSDVGVDQVDCGVASWVKHFVEIEDIVGSSVLF